MKIAIVAAMDKELKLLKELMPEHTECCIEGECVYRGLICGHEVVLTKCGIGKVNSALRTYSIIQEFHPGLVINSGVAGGADVHVPIGTVLVASGAGYHDVWCGPGTEPCEADGFPKIFRPYENGMKIVEELKSINPELQTGIIATGDVFITTPEQISHIREAYPEAKACDMESASIAQTCAACKVPYMVVRVISDTPGSGNNFAQYTNFFSEAPEKTFRIIEEILARL